VLRKDGKDWHVFVLEILNLMNDVVVKGKKYCQKISIVDWI
jgi:hypothetical protein